MPTTLPRLLRIFPPFRLSLFFPPSPLPPYLGPPSAHISLQPCHLSSSVWSNSNDSRRCPDPVLPEHYHISIPPDFFLFHSNFPPNLPISKSPASGLALVGPLESFVNHLRGRPQPEVPVRHIGCAGETIMPSPARVTPARSTSEASWVRR